MTDHPNSDLDDKWRSIGLQRDYSALDLSGIETDIQGWSVEHPMFANVIKQFAPRTIIEVGTWKGASLQHMSQLAVQAGLDTKFICVDTWLGSNAGLWTDDQYRSSLMLVGDYPSMWKQFIHNIQAMEIADRVYPLPMTSSAAAYLLRDLDVTADAVYIDAGHEEAEVMIDLELYWQRVNPGGVMFGDDYLPAWPGVVAAVNKFAARIGIPVWTSPTKFLFAKPPE